MNEDRNQLHETFTTFLKNPFLHDTSDTMRMRHLLLQALLRGENYQRILDLQDVRGILGQAKNNPNKIQ